MCQRVNKKGGREGLDGGEARARIMEAKWQPTRGERREGRVLSPYCNVSAGELAKEMQRGAEGYVAALEREVVRGVQEVAIGLESVATLGGVRGRALHEPNQGVKQSEPRCRGQ
jgi:hypothetical protein